MLRWFDLWCGPAARVLVVDLDHFLTRRLIAGLRLGRRFGPSLSFAAAHAPTVHRPKSLPLQSNLHVTVREHDLDISGAQPHPIVEARGDNRPVEDQLGELLSSLAAHTDHDSIRAAPHAVACCLEASSGELTDLIGCLRRRHDSGPADGFGRRGFRSWRRLAEPCLLQGKSQQLGTLFLFKERR